MRSARLRYTPAVAITVTREQIRQRNAGVSLSVGVTVSHSQRVSVLLPALSSTCVRIRRVVDRPRESRRPRVEETFRNPRTRSFLGVSSRCGLGSARPCDTHNEILHSASARWLRRTSIEARDLRVGCQVARTRAHTTVWTRVRVAFLLSASNRRTTHSENVVHRRSTTMP